MFAGDLLQSYGGGVAAHIIGDSSTTFRCGISVAPVASKAYYGQQLYTENLNFLTLAITMRRKQRPGDCSFAAP